MFTLAKEDYSMGQELLSSLPERIAACLSGAEADRLMEVRLRCGSALTVIRTDGSYFVAPGGRLTHDYGSAVKVTAHDIRRGMELITRCSVYAYESEIRNGYITLAGGHRVGICGDAVCENGKISHMRSVQALNYRYAREIIGAADGVMDRITDGNTIKNTVIISPPMCGKTTMLRDIARSLSLMGKRVSIVDERCEIAALSFGESPFDLGAGCDVLSGVSKADGMLLMLRSMSPDVIITDEIGDDKDFAAIREIKKRGVSIITTLHGGINVQPEEFDLIIRLGGVGKCLN